MMKFLVVDAHPVLREGTAAALRQSFAPSAIIIAADAEEAYRLSGRHPDLAAVLLDLDLPGRVGMQLLKELAQRRRSWPILVLSLSEQREDVQRAFLLGASGYLPKSMRAPMLAAVVRLVIEGGVYVPPLVLADRPCGVSRDVVGSVSQLTGRQSEILVRIASGEANAAIARALSLSEKTVKVHVTAILRTLQVSDRHQAGRLAHEAGLL